MMAKNNKKSSATAAEIWAKFDQADENNKWFEYECYHPELGHCVRNTALEYCPIISREEALKRERESKDFNGIVSQTSGKEFSPNYWYYMDDTNAEDPEFFAVRKRAVITS